MLELGAVLTAIEHEGVPRIMSAEELRRWLDSRLTRAHDRAVFDLSDQTQDSAGELFRVRP